MRLYGWETVMISYHPTKFGGHGHSRRGDVMVLLSHVILQNHVSNGLTIFMNSFPSREFTILPSLVAIGAVIVEKSEIRNSNVVNGGHVLQRKRKETIILNKYDLKWKETSEKCKWEHRTR